MNARDELEAHAAMGALYSRLAGMLAGREALEDEVVAVRADLAVACARAGNAEDAVYQAEELLKDCKRELGEEHASTRRAQEAKDQVWRLIEAG